MSFFGQNNSNQQSSGFGGFGSSSTNTGGGFGQPATSGTGFGSGATGTTGGFGGFGSGGTSGFGANNNNANTSLFGQNKPAFGASTGGGGLFGSSTATANNSTGFGGFGSSNTGNTGNTGGGLFGSTASKPAFGGGSTGGGLFGSTNTGGFGSTNNQQTSGFGASTALNQNNAVCEGTGNTPFSAYTEKEGTSAVTNHFQSISFMAPYRNFSPEELRLADYSQGRRYGNGSGQAGAFGSTNFGGFGQSNTTSGGFGQPSTTSAGGLFGSNTATSAPFGSNQNTGFGGSNTGSSLFGQKPAGGLFGTTSSSSPSGGLFGTASNATSGFGSGGTGGGFGSSGGGLFGQNNNQQQQQQQQSKPFSFGSTTATSGGGFGQPSSTGFGQTNNNTNTGSSLFGATNQASSNPFGQQNTTQSSNPFGGGFGQQNQTQNQTPNPSTFGGFGQQNTQEQKPGGLFGNASSSSNTGGGLFGNQNNTQPSGGLFGQSTNNQNTGSSLFGQKPATSGGLFGQPANTTNTNSSSNLFGFGNNNASQSQPQQAQSGGLFGNVNNNQQKPGGLFGNTSSTTGSNLFGNSNNNTTQQPSGGLFNLGASNNQQQQQQQPSGNSLFGNLGNTSQGSSLFGNPQQQQPPPPNQFQPAQTLQTSIADPNAFGSPSIFSGLPPPPQVSGPIATPISQKTKQKKAALLPYYKMTPSTPSRLQTPQKRGFGFSYSTYGTPGSAASNASTPGTLGSSFLSGGFSRSLGKSLSTSNLRGSYGDTDSVLTPGAFSANSSRYGGAGSMKKLTIDRSLRTDLFGDRGGAALPSPEKERQPGILKKKVSFDASTVGGNGQHGDATQTNGITNQAASSSATPSAEEQGFLRSPRNQARSKPNGLPAHPEAEVVRGNELAIVPEDESQDVTSVPPKRPSMPRSQEDQQPGEYWMNPSKDQLQKMSKDQLRRVTGLSVGREGCGKVEFNEPVDISNISLKDIYNNIVVISLRSLTVYPDQAKKPPQGKGLNVPSTIYLENSWPRARDKRTPVSEKNGSRFNKHVERLRRVGGTEFVTYEKDTGTWIFKVPHFTTYGFDYDDDDASEDESLHLSNSTMTEPPDTPTPKSRLPSNGMTPRASSATQEQVALTNGSSQTSVQPANTSSRQENQPLPGAFSDAEIPDQEVQDMEMEEVQDDVDSFLDERSSSSDSGEEEPSEMDEDNDDLHQQALILRDAVEDMEVEMAGAFPEANEDSNALLGPLEEDALIISDDWAQELERTIRPRKQDRQALRKAQDDKQANHAINGLARSPAHAPADNKPIATHIDIAKSLFGYSQPAKDESVSKSARKSILKHREQSGLEEEDSRSSSSNVNQMRPSNSVREPDRQWHELISRVKAKYPITLAQTSNLTPQTLTHQRYHTKFALRNGVPMAEPQRTPFANISRAVEPESAFEKAVWTLASILFDDQRSESYGIPTSEKDKYEARIRKDRLAAFWQGLCEEQAKNVAAEASGDEERAFAFLSVNKVVEACEVLVKGKNYRLATLVAQIGGDDVLHQQMATQITAWRDLNVLSEMSEPIRGLYSLLAGETCQCEGKKAQHIEDKATSFHLSSRFNLDWKRAFGLRLYYAIKTSDPLEAAVKLFADDLTNRGEQAGPGDDILYLLLQIYAASKEWLPFPALAHILLPQTPTPTALTTRLSFQLYHALTIRFPPSSSSSASDTVAAADTLASLFAVQLDNVGEWLLAMFSLMHITDAQQREEGIKALLALHARDITTDNPDEDEIWKTLVTEFTIPEAWIWQAKALQAKAVDGDRVQETMFLLRAKRWGEAHEVLRRVVGPECVISEEWDRLGEVLEAFKAGKSQIRDWDAGGQVFEDFVRLMGVGGGGGGGVEGKERYEILGSLGEVVPGFVRGVEEERRTQGDGDGMEGSDGQEGFRQMVALKEIWGRVRREALLLREKDGKATKGLQVPKAENPYLKGTMGMSERWQRNVLRGRGS